MELFSSYNIIIGISIVIILSFIFNGVAKKTKIPAVLLLITLGITFQYLFKFLKTPAFDFFPLLEIIGIVGLIMIVLEAALELELKKEKLVPIVKALGVAAIGLIASTYAAAYILVYGFEGMTLTSALVYATPLSILSSAIIIPSVVSLSAIKKEFHVYESTFSDILGIMLFYFLVGTATSTSEENSGIGMFSLNILLTIIVSLLASYLIIFVFQKIQSSVKLFLLIAVLLLMYALGKKMHLSSLIIILIFGLVIANMKLFFSGKLNRFLDQEKAEIIYHQLHIVTAETAFVVRTLFFVIFGITIALNSLLSLRVAVISVVIMISIYLIRFILLRIVIGKDLMPQLLIAPRGLITVLLFYAIPTELTVSSFEPGILLFIIIGTSMMMTWGMISFSSGKESRLTPAEIEKYANEEIDYLLSVTTDLSTIKEEETDLDLDSSESFLS